ncbi:MAG: STAS-like domain-containing protein [Thermoguttaceae bacterium]
MSEPDTIYLSHELGTDLSSRARAASIRVRVLKSIDSGQTIITIDLSGIRSLSESFADELFAVLAKTKGDAWFREHLRLNNASNDVRYSILEAIDSRVGHGV